MPANHSLDLIGFLDASPTSYHAVDEVARRLRAAGFSACDEAVAWMDVPDAGFVVRDGALASWRLPTAWRPEVGLRIFAAHGDSPALKLKPAGEYGRVNYRMVNVEVYGSPVLATWFDRDLALAGRIVDSSGATHLVRTGAIARVPGLAIHLDRSANSQLNIDAQRDLMAMLGLGDGIGPVELAAGQAGIGPDQVLGHDLFLVSGQSAAQLGTDGELLASARQDDLLSVFAGLRGFLASQPSVDVQMLVIGDHEEIGSGTPSGASGPFVADILRRLSAAHGLAVDAHLAWLARGWCVSADVTHALHPNRPERHDPTVFPLLGAGPVLKWSAPMRYATDATTMACWQRACRAAEVESQVFVNNNSIPGGSSLGPLLATRLGIRSVDAGVPILGMHSIREICALADQVAFAEVARAFLEAA